jgi:hypothetical protein
MLPKFSPLLFYAGTGYSCSINPVNKLLSPWYEVNSEREIKTHEYIFKKYDLKRW